MILICSQCGAKIKRDIFKRFITCPYCKSSLIVEQDRTVKCFILKHIRNDLWVRGVFRSWFKRADLKGSAEDIKIDFKLFPVWHTTFEDGQTTTQPAAGTPHTEISSIKIPAGDLSFFDESVSLAEAIAPTVKHEAATVWASDTHHVEREVNRLWLVYLPIYFIDYNLNGEHHRASIVGESTRVYSDTASAYGAFKIPIRNLVFFSLAFGTLLIVSFSISGDIFIKGVSAAAAAIFFSAVSWFYLRR